jgi:hypothetical protein
MLEGNPQLRLRHVGRDRLIEPARVHAVVNDADFLAREALANQVRLDGLGIADGEPSPAVEPRANGLLVPLLPHVDVPLGADDEGNAGEDGRQPAPGVGGE